MKPDWQIVYDEEVWDHNGNNFAGIFQDMNSPSHVLFFHAYKDLDDDPIETCYVYTSIFMEGNGPEECQYPWIAQNDAILINCLNSCGNNFFGDDSPIRTLKFKSLEEI